MRIAVLSDSDFNRVALVRALEECRHAVTYTGDTTFASVRAAFRHGAAVFLLDVGGSDPARAREACEMVVPSPGGEVAVGVATTMPDSPALPALFEAGLAAYVTLTINRGQLCGMLRAIDQGEGCLSVGLGPLRGPAGEAWPDLLAHGGMSVSATDAEREIMRMMGAGAGLHQQLGRSHPGLVLPG